VGRNLQLGPYVAIIVEATGDVEDSVPLRAALAVADPTPSGVPDVVARVARGMVSVLIAGETGVGKDVLARRSTSCPGAAGSSWPSIAPA